MTSYPCTYTHCGTATLCTVGVQGACPGAPGVVHRCARGFWDVTPGFGTWDAALVSNTAASHRDPKIRARVTADGESLTLP